MKDKVIYTWGHTIHTLKIFLIISHIKYQYIKFNLKQRWNLTNIHYLSYLKCTKSKIICAWQYTIKLSKTKSIRGNRNVHRATFIKNYKFYSIPSSQSTRKENRQKFLSILEGRQPVVVVVEETRPIRKHQLYRRNVNNSLNDKLRALRVGFSR